MDIENFKLYLLEQNIVILWHFTKTKQGCIAFVDSLHDMQHEYPANSVEHNIVKDCRDLAFTKGQIFQLLDNQRDYAGDL